MFGLFKRTTNQIDVQSPETSPVDHDVRREAMKSEAYEELKRDVQLFLHAHRLFPSKISVNEDNWAEIAFYPSNAQREEAAGVLRGLHRDGRITVKGQLQPTTLNGWSAQLRLNM